MTSITERLFKILTRFVGERSGVRVGIHDVKYLKITEDASSSQTSVISTKNNPANESDENQIHVYLIRKTCS